MKSSLKSASANTLDRLPSILFEHHTEKMLSITPCRRSLHTLRSGHRSWHPSRESGTSRNSRATVSISFWQEEARRRWGLVNQRRELATVRDGMAGLLQCFFARCSTQKVHRKEFESHSLTLTQHRRLMVLSTNTMSVSTPA